MSVSGSTHHLPHVVAHKITHAYGSTAIDDLVKNVTFNRHARHMSMCPFEYLLKMWEVFDDATIAKIVRLLFESGDTFTPDDPKLFKGRHDLVLERITLWNVRWRPETLRAFLDNGIVPFSEFTPVHLVSYAVTSGRPWTYLKLVKRAGYDLDVNTGSIYNLFDWHNGEFRSRVKQFGLLLHHSDTPLTQKTETEIREYLDRMTHAFNHHDHPMFDKRLSPEEKEILTGVLTAYHQRRLALSNMVDLHVTVTSISQDVMDMVWEYARGPPIA